MNLNKPNRNAIVSTCGNWVSSTANGYILYLKNSNGFEHFFKFIVKIERIIFSPTGNTIYVIDSNSVIWKRSLTSRSLKNDIANFVFSILISLPFNLNFDKFTTIIPFEKILYLISENKVHLIGDGSIINSIDLEKTVTSVYIIPIDIAKNYNLIDSESISLFAVICGASDGTISTLLFPNNFVVHDSLSNPFVSKSEPIQLFSFTPKYFCVVGKYGTIECVSYNNKSETGSLPFPISSVCINDPNILFVSGKHLYSSPLLQPSSYHLLPTFPSRIYASNESYALTASGMLLPITTRLYNASEPKPELIEYALEELKKIQEEKDKMKRFLQEAESHLSDLQLIRCIQSGRISFNSEVKLTPSMSPDNRVITELYVKLEPIGAFSCEGLSILINITDTLQNIDSYSIPNVKTVTLTWQRKIYLVSSSMIKCDIIVSHGSDSALAYTCNFDILDYSIPIDPSTIEMGTNPMSTERIIASFSFPLFGTLPPELIKPMAMKTPTGETWTTRCDNGICNVNASSKSIINAIRAAFERRVKIQGTFAFSPFDETIANLRTEADDIIAQKEEIVPVKGGVKAKSEHLSNAVSDWIIEKLTNE